MAQDLGGEGPMGSDNNPILQAVIVSRASPPTAPSDVLLNVSTFLATVAPGSTVGQFSSLDVNGGTHAYTLVAGEGDTNNALFEIDDDMLQPASSVVDQAGNTLSIRVRSTDEDDLFTEKVFELIVSGDSDGDSLLDTWELAYAADLTELTGLADGPGPGVGTGDLDGDGSSDSDEFAKGTSPTDVDSDDDGSEDGAEAANGTDPLDSDSDDDGLDDGAEAEAGSNPLKSDTDGDGLSDSAEVKGNPATDPTKADSDGDGVSDRIEIELGSNPNDPNDTPPTDTVVFNGFVSEIFGPDDLHLDPATAVIAVDVFGDENREVNGVLFQTDRDDGGVAERDGVIVTTTATNSIDGWAAAPAFVGGQGDSAANLGEIMADIRWEAAPNPVTVDIEGLAPGALYEVQLLVNEGGDRNRHWDIGVEDELVVDDFGSEGLTGVAGGIWTPENSFAYTGEFTPSADGILNIVMQQDLGGQAPMGTDNNPILQAIIVHSAGPGQIFQIINVTSNAAEVSLTWTSAPGAVYSVDYKKTLTEQFWIELDDSVASEGETTTFTDDNPVHLSEPEGYYRIRQVE